MGEATDNLLRWQSVKRVRAGEITEVMDDGCFVRCDTGISIFLAYDEGMTNRHQPVAGDYWIIYEDGYQSFSPRSAFETGYIPIEED